MHSVSQKLLLTYTQFYMLQLLVDDKKDTYYTHTRWGR